MTKIERYEGDNVVLPTKMTIRDAAEFLVKKMKSDELNFTVNHTLDAFPHDGAYAFKRAVKKIYGDITPVDRVEKTIFGDKVTPPKTIGIEVDYNKFVDILWGDFEIPGIKGMFSTEVADKNGMPIFLLSGKIHNTHVNEVLKIMELAREFLKNDSLYKGKAISIKSNDSGGVDFESPPKFLDLSRVNPDELTFSDTTRSLVETNLFTPIEHTTECRKHKIPLKRGVLLEGPFGTGKTLTAFVTAVKAKKNGWTFILVDDVCALDGALDFARMYQPAVVFAEDIDRAISGQNRTTDIDDILNTIDGVESKGTEIITILTSNDVKSINRAMLRPGRLDAIISVEAPDQAAVEKLIRLYGRNLLDTKASYKKAATALKGQIPAVIREAVERSKLSAIKRTNGKSCNITEEDLHEAATGMTYHLELLNKKDAEKPENSLDNYFRQLVQEVVGGTTYDHRETSEKTFRSVSEVKTMVEELQ